MLLLVFDMIRLHMVFAYSKIGQMIALNVATIGSFCLPHLVELCAFKLLRVCFAYVIVMFIQGVHEVSLQFKKIITK